MHTSFHVNRDLSFSGNNGVAVNYITLRYTNPISPVCHNDGQISKFQLNSRSDLYVLRQSIPCMHYSLKFTFLISVPEHDVHLLSLEDANKFKFFKCAF